MSLRWGSSPQTSREMEIRAAKHEAGHAIVAWACPTILEVHAVHMDSDPSPMTMVAYRFADPLNQIQAWETCAHIMGGMAGEAVLLRRLNSGNSRKDLQMAWEKALIIRTEPPTSWDKDTPVALDIGKMFGSPPPEHIRKVLNRSYKRALNIARRHRHKVEQLAEVLLKRRSLDRNQILDIYGPRPWAMFA